MYNHATCEGWKLECGVADLYSMNRVFLCQPRKKLTMAKASSFLVASAVPGSDTGDRFWYIPAQGLIKDVTIGEHLK